jgi:transcriptional regulator with XRE-family HTH domain
VQGDNLAFQKRIGKRIREMRSSKGFSQESFAHACGLHRTSMSLLERGRINVTVNTLRAMSKTLGVTLSELLKGVD